MHRWWIVAILGLALCVRLAWVLLVPNAQYSDSLWYEAAAANLAANGVYGPDQPSAWFPPGYPFFLAVIYKAFGYWQLAGKLGNVVLGTGSAVLAYLLARKLIDHKAALLAGVLVAVWPNLVFHTGILSSDLLATFGFLASLWLATRRGWPSVLLLGLVLGW